MTAVGTFRIYFNRSGAAQLVWCVATDHWELAVRRVVVNGTGLISHYVPKATPDDEDGKPSAFFVVTGSMTVEDGVARIGAL